MVLAKQHSSIDLAASRVITYTYDGLARLTQASEQPGRTTSYVYDLAGNRTQVKLNGYLTEVHAYNAANQVLGWQYDAAGNLLSDGTTTSTYDSLNRTLTTTATGQARTMRYNGDGTLVGQISNSVPTTYTQDLASPLSQILQLTQAGTTTNYLYGVDRLAAVDGGTRTWYASDALGSVRQTLDDTGTPLGVVSYDAWGTPETGMVPTFGFTGELQDAGTGLVNLRARWYSAGSGTFTTFRWRTSESDDTVPYTHHGYAYALSNPILLTDHSGRCSERGQGDDYCRETAAERKAVQDYRWWHPTETCGPPPEEDLFFGERYSCNERTGRYERILGGTIAVTPSANGIKLVVGAAVLACTAVASWLGIKAATSQPSSIAGNTASNASAPTPPPNPQEQALRKILGQDYDLIGTVDDDVRTYLNLPKNSKIADVLGTSKSTGRWLVAESKGNHIDTAVQQLRTTVNGLLNKEPSATGNIDLRIYTNEQQWNRIVNDPRGLGGYKVDTNGLLGYFDDIQGRWVYEEVNGMKIVVQQVPK